jgi:transposase
MATAHVWHSGLGIPVRTVPEVLQVLTGVNLTESALIQDAPRRVTQGVGQEYQDLREQMAHAAVVQTNDTGWVIGGVPGSLMTFETSPATVDQVRDQHRNEEVREVIPGDYPGVMVTDRGTSYDARELSGVQPQNCLAQVLRSINEVLANQTGKACWFGHQLKQVLQAALELWQGFQAGTISTAQSHRLGQELKQALTEHLTPRKLSDADNQRLLTELGWHPARGNLVRFWDDPSIPPTTNAGERAWRPAVIARKVSHGSKTEGGARTFSAVSSVIRTAVNQGRDAVEWLCEVFRHTDARAAPS